MTCDGEWKDSSGGEGFVPREYSSTLHRRLPYSMQQHSRPLESNSNSA